MKRATAPAASDPIARRIRTARRDRGLTLEELARRAAAGLGASGGTDARSRDTVSACYLSLIENGRKVPNEAIAVALAEALDDDPRLYRAWVRARKHTELDAALEAAEILRRLLTDPPPSIALARAGADPAPPGASTARLRVPVIAAGADPGEGLRPECAILAWRRLDLATLPAADRARVSRPFAYPLGDAATRRVRDRLEPRGLALVLREFPPLEPERVYAVRSGWGVVLSRVLWNGRQLLLVPAPGASDFEVLEARDEARLRKLVLGLAVMAAFDRQED